MLSAFVIKCQKRGAFLHRFSGNITIADFGQKSQYILSDFQKAAVRAAWADCTWKIPAEVFFCTNDRIPAQPLTNHGG